MKFHVGILSVLLCLVAGSVLAQSPDTTYVRIYQMIQDADSMRESGQGQQAILRYRGALSELQKFKELYPSWNQNIIAYRLNYVNSKLSALGADPVVAEPQPAEATESAPGTPTGPSAEQLQQLQVQIQNLTQQNNLLQQKLKEAWAAQPTVLDPRQLAQAEQRIRELEKERDLLLVTLDSQPPTPAAEAALLQQEQALLAQFRKELADQKTLNQALQSENATLKQQVVELQSSRPVQPIPEGDLSRQLAQAQATIDTLRSTNVSLLTRQILMETRLADMTQQILDRGSSRGDEALKDELKETRSMLKEATRERDQLGKQLERANRRLEGRAGDSPTEQELSLAQARLTVLEAEAVPFTQEELALVNHRSNIEMTASTAAPSPVTNKVHELPPGAGPLMAQAERAIETGRFEEAESKLREILRQDPDNVPTLFRLAGVLLDLKRPQESEQALQTALQADPNDPGSNFLMGLLKYQQGKFDEAMDALSLSSKYNSERPETQYYLGLTLLQKGNRGPAETALRKAIQLRPGWGDAHYELAVVYATQDPPFKELAEWHYQKAISGGTPRNFNLEKLLEGE